VVRRGCVRRGGQEKRSGEEVKGGGQERWSRESEEEVWEVVRRGGQGRSSVEKSAIEVIRGDQLRWSGEEEVRRGGGEKVTRRVRRNIRNGCNKKRSGTG
jgi:hypothetical protein